MNTELYEELKRVARSGQPTTYSDVAPLVGLDMAIADHRNRIAALLDEISRYEHSQGRPLLSAVVIHKGEPSRPGQGFYKMARSLGKFRGGDEDIYWISEVQAVFDAWRGDPK